MAAPSHVTAKAMNGKFLMNKALSDGIDEILLLQGMSWVKRRAIAMFPLHLTIKHSTNEAGIERIDIIQRLTGTFTSAVEDRILDWQERGEQDDMFGHVTEKSGRIPVEDITDEFLKQDWTQDTVDDGLVFTDSWSTPGKNSYTWRAIQAWGFAMVNGERRYVRRTTFTSSQKDSPIHTRFIYDYLGQV